MTRIADTRTLTDARTLVGVFLSERDAWDAAHALDIAGFAPDRVGIVADDVRQAREMAGSYSPQGALAGAMLGALFTVAYVVFGGEVIRENPVAIVLGGISLIVAFTAIGWLFGRARVLKEERYAIYEDAVDEGEALVSVVCETEDGEDQARAILERAGAVEVRREESSEAV